MKHYITTLILILIGGFCYGQVSNDFNPENPPEPSAQYTLTLQSFPGSGGTVSGGGKYATGTRVRVSASANTGFRFTGWTDEKGDVISSASYFYYTMGSQHTALTATFVYDPSNPEEPSQQKLKHVLTLVSEPVGAGTFNINSGEKHKEGDVVYLYSNPTTGFKFSCWKMGDEVLSTNRSYSHTMGTTDQEIKSVFYYDPSNPDEPGKPTEQLYSLITLTIQAPPKTRTVYPVYLLNQNIDITAVSFDIQFPEGVPVDYTEATLAANRNNGHTMIINPAEDKLNLFHIEIKGDAALQESEGVLVYIPVTIPESWANHESHPVILSNAYIDGSLILPTKNGAVTSFIDDSKLNIYANFYTDAFMNRVQFKNLSSKEATNYLWEFGDGTKSTEKEPLHVFASSGDYAVKLIVSNEFAKDSIQLKVSIPSQDTWKWNGSVALNKELAGVKSFVDATELFTSMNMGAVTGDITVQVQGGQTFDVLLSAEMNTLLQSLEQKFAAGKFILDLKAEEGTMAHINFMGMPNAAYFATIMKLGSRFKLNNVGIQIFGIPVDVATISAINGQVICSGEEMDEVNLKNISAGLTFNWMATNVAGAISGYSASGTDIIPKAVLHNSSSEADSLIYKIEVKVSGALLYECAYKVVVLPGLSGSLTELSPGNKEEVDTKTVNLSWRNIANSVYDVYLWEAGTEIPKAPIATNLTNYRYKNDSFCEYGKKYQWKVVARNNCTTIESEVEEFGIRALPNLHVTTLSNQSAIAGKSMKVSWTVRNDGKGSTKSATWKDYVWLVPDIYTGTTNECTLLAQVANVSALNPNEAYDNSVDVTLPERITGNYYLLVTSNMYNIQQIDWTPTGKNEVADPYTPSLDGTPYPYLKCTTDGAKRMEEDGETTTVSDNFFYKTLTIELPPLPDLFVSSIIPPDNFYSGQDIKVNATITNQGVGNVVEDYWYDALYMSHENTLDTNTAKLLATHAHKGNLNAGTSYNVEFTANIPLDYYGMVYFFVVTDMNDQVFEHANAGNNTTVSNAVNVVLTPPADLIPVSIEIPTIISTGADFGLTAQIRNEGAGYPNNDYWTDNLYLSKKTSGIDDTAIQLFSVYHTGKLAPGNSYTVNKNITLGNLSEGPYYVYIKVDGDNRVFELAETKTNNVLMLKEPVTVVKPDLKSEIASVEQTLFSGKIYPLTWKVMNSGEGEVKDRNISDNVFISRSPSGTNPIYITDINYGLTLKAGEEKTFTQNITLPYNESLNGTCYLFVKTDNGNNIYEKNENNNLSPAREVVYRYVPKPDISVSGLVIPKQVKPGETLTLDYALNNVGAVAINAVDYQISVYLSSKSYLDKTAIKCDEVSHQGDYGTIPAKGTVKVTQIVNISQNMPGGNQYVFVMVDSEKVLDEANTSNNIISEAIFIAGNLADLAITKSVLPDVASSGTEIELEWTVTNNGDLACGSRSDAVYLSTDNVLSSDDERLAIINSAGLEVAGSQNMKAKITVPDKWNGKRFLIIKLDYYNQNVVINEGKKILVSSLDVSLSPLPDLQLKDISLSGECISGQPLTIYYRVENNGLNATRQNKWSDEFYLSETTSLDKNNGIYLGRKMHVGVVESGEFYQDSIEVNIPSYASGNYTLFAYADAGNVVYESGSESNNMRDYAVTVRRPLPADLAMEEVIAPGLVIAGEQVDIRYKIKNNSTYPASGILKDAIYVSEDAVWDADDQMVGTTSAYMTINAGATLERTATGVFTNIPVGNYYVIVRTNITNSVIESSMSNNAASTQHATTVDFKELVPGGSDVIQSSGYFKINANAWVGETLALDVQSDDENIPTGLYVAYNKVPTVSGYDFASSKLQSEKQEVIIPSLKNGTYYLLARDNSSNSIDNLFSLNGEISIPGGQTSLSISSRILQFEIAGVNTNEGGNGGSVTSDITGAKFDTIMDFRLKNMEQYIPAEAVYFQNQTSSYVTFNLRDVVTGTYDVVAELPGGMKTALPDGYKVVSGVSVPLYTKIVTPSSVRLSTKIPFSVEYGNTGSTDINVSELLLVSENGHPIGLNTQELDSMRTEIRIPLYSSEGGNKPAVLSPNSKGTRTVFVHANNAASISLKLYIIWKD